MLLAGFFGRWPNEQLSESAGLRDCKHRAHPLGQITRHRPGDLWHPGSVVLGRGSAGGDSRHCGPRPPKLAGLTRIFLVAPAGCRVALACPWSRDVGRAGYVGGDVVRGPASVSVLVSDSLLELDAVTVRFGGRAVLRDADLAIARGEIIGVSGPNGAGKTTLLRVAANMLRPAIGRRIGVPRLAYVPAAVDPPLLHAGVWLAGVRRARRFPPGSVLERLGFDGALDRPCRELSFGNVRKVLLADAFSSLADLIVIDEATEGLDSRGAAALVELMVEARSRGASVLFAEQQTQRMVGADRLVSVRHGTLVVEALPSSEVTVSLRGPAQALGELTKAAEALGFRYIVERE